MKVKDLRLILDQYEDEDLIFVEITMGGGYRIDKGIIKPANFDENLYSILTAEKSITNALLVLKLE